MTITLIITTYNWKEALELVLLSVLQQTRLPDELIIDVQERAQALASHLGTNEVHQRLVFGRQDRRLVGRRLGRVRRYRAEPADRRHEGKRRSAS